MDTKKEEEEEEDESVVAIPMAEDVVLYDGDVDGML